MIYKRKPNVLDLISHLTRLPVKRKRKKRENRTTEANKTI
jgi:hypothetical protein